MTTQNRIKTVLTLAVVAILALAIGQVQAESIEINGDFKMYKPGTNYTVRARSDAGNFWVNGIGDNQTVLNGVIVDYDDSTTGTTIDCPGWISPITLPLWRDGADFTTGNVQLFQPSEVPDGTSALNCFGAWSSQNGNLAESAESLGNVAPSSAYTLSARYDGNAFPLTFELRAGGVTITPSASVTPNSNPAGWSDISRTYLAKDIAAYVGQALTIRVGTTPPHTTAETDPDRLTGQRGKFDNITLTVENDDPTLPDVDAGIDMISWSGQAVTMDPNVVNNDTAEPQGTLTYLWTAEPNGIGDPNLDVAITGADTENASVTITKTAPTGDATVVTMTLAVTLEGEDPVKDSMTIDVYDDACVAALDLGLTTIDTTDLDGNCITAFPDFAVMAVTWLDDYALTEAVAK